MSTHFADGSTVVGNDDFRDQQESLKPKHKSPLPTTASSTRRVFINDIESELEERPFFVLTGKDGLIAALQKLDRQLREVSRTNDAYATLFNNSNSLEDSNCYRRRKVMN